MKGNLTASPGASARLQSRFRGCLLGGAVGDALGAPVEFLSASAIVDRFGPSGIRDYAPAYGRVGAITDDTQMTLFTAEGLLRAYVRGATRGIVSIESVVRDAYRRWLRTQDRPDAAVEHDDGWLMSHRDLFARRAPGNTCLAALRESHGAELRARNRSKGCGGVMRMAPVGMMFGHDTHASMGRIFELGADLAAITHGHPSGYLSAGAFAVIVACVLRGHTLGAAVAHAKSELRRHEDHAEVVRAIERAEALAATSPAHLASVEKIGEGWVAEEALAIGLYCALSTPDLESGIVLAVNHGGDSDSTGSIAGSLLGAMHGVDTIPDRWLGPLELRSVIEAVADDLLTFPAWDLGSDTVDGGADHVQRYPPA